MTSIIVEGNTPLIGSVSVSGSKNSAIRLIYAAMYSNEDVILENVPRVQIIEDELDIIRSVGGTAQWVGKNTLLLNGSTIESYKIPFKLARHYRTTFLFTGVLLYRFGKAYIPKIEPTSYKISPINRLLDTWDNLGIIYVEDDNYYMLSNENLKASMINFKLPTNIGTAHALLIAACLHGDTVINNVSQDPEIDELISFLSAMGVTLIRFEPTKIKVTGTNIFKGVTWVVSPDKTEIVSYAVATLITNGNVLIKNVDRESLTAFSYFLMKIGAKFEFDDDGLKIWNSGEKLLPTSANISPYPGLVADWQPLLTLLLCKSEGESYIQDLVYTDRFDYIKDLNRMGAKIDLLKPSEIGKTFSTLDDSYDAKKGEPATVIKIMGPIRLKAEKLDIMDMRYGAILLLAALSAEGKSYISSFEKIEGWYEDIVEKLKNLGAKIRYVSVD